MSESAKALTTTAAVEQEEPGSADLGQLLAATVANNSARSANAISGVIIGELVGFEASGQPLVQFAENPTDEPFVARSTVKFSKPQIGDQVVLMFENGDFNRPVVLGALQNPAPEANEQLPIAGPWEAEVDDERLVLTAKREIELRCGKASIILTKAGKILLRGAYVLSRSSGTNRIKGASVQIN